MRGFLLVTCPGELSEPGKHRKIPSLSFSLAATAPIKLKYLLMEGKWASTFGRRRNVLAPNLTGFGRKDR
ncbi:hypothetical protein PH5382_03087 [Phaeobacter sp. CECT 5382]|nr:hypothetical protein PH5382_03087 [Phaeobacter sp. CECT 5382]